MYLNGNWPKVKFSRINQNLVAAKICFSFTISVQKWVHSRVWQKWMPLEITRFMCTHQIFILSLSRQMLHSRFTQKHKSRRVFSIILRCVAIVFIYKQIKLNMKYAPRVLSITLTTLNTGLKVFFFFLKCRVAITADLHRMPYVSSVHFSFMSWHNGVHFMIAYGVRLL